MLAGVYGNLEAEETVHSGEIRMKGDKQQRINQCLKGYFAPKGDWEMSLDKTCPVTPNISAISMCFLHYGCKVQDCHWAAAVSQAQAEQLGCTKSVGSRNASEAYGCGDLNKKTLQEGKSGRRKYNAS